MTLIFELYLDSFKMNKRLKVIVRTHTHRADCSTWTTKVIVNKTGWSDYLASFVKLVITHARAQLYLSQRDSTYDVSYAFNRYRTNRCYSSWTILHRTVKAGM